MKAALELSVPSELHANHFIEQQAHKVEGLRHRAAFVSDFGHGEMQFFMVLVCIAELGTGVVCLRGWECAVKGRSWREGGLVVFQ